MRKPVTASGTQVHAFVARLVEQRRDHRRILDHVRERLAGSISPSKVRKVGRIASSTLELVTTMSRIGCAPSSIAPQTPMVSNNRRAAAAIAEARASPAAARSSPGRRPSRQKLPSEPCRSAIASARPGKPPPRDQDIGLAVGVCVRHCCQPSATLDLHRIGPRPVRDRRRERAFSCPTPSRIFSNVLDLETLEVNLFRGRSPPTGWQRVFGGQVIGQALVAASRTVEGVAAHSLHAYFILGGDPKVPIIYEVERTRDGKSFTTRSVKAIQHGQPIFTMMVSFHNNEEGLDHQVPMPKVPPPEELPSEAECAARHPADAAGTGAPLLRARPRRSICARSNSSIISARNPRTDASMSGFKTTGRCRTIRRSINACSPMPPT